MPKPKLCKERFNNLAKQGCVVCRLFHGVVTPACIHHLTGIQYRSTGKKAKDEHTIPLCYNHHQGAQGIHTIGMSAWENMFGTQTELLNYANDLLEAIH